MAKDAAYTFKGLYKTSDWLEISFTILLVVPLVFSIFSLGLGQYVPGLALQILVTISSISSICGLVYRKKFDEIQLYRELANEFKTVYDELEMEYRSSDFSNLNKLREQISSFRTKTSYFSISSVGRWWSKCVIKEEMDLGWVDEK